jgi:hypothetical protein
MPVGTDRLMVQRLDHAHDGSTVPVPVVLPGEKGTVIAEWYEYTPNSGTDIAVTSPLRRDRLITTPPVVARRGVSPQMAIGLRILPEPGFRQLLTVLRRIGPMTKKEYDFVNFVLDHVTYRSRYAMWLSIARKRFGRLKKGRFHPGLGQHPGKRDHGSTARLGRPST